MSRTITAMFDSRSEAEAACQRLTASNIDADRVRIIDQQSGSGSSSGSHGQHEGFWASLKDMFMPDEDRHAYGEGIRRGGYMIIAEVDDSQADQACRTLDQAGGVDFDQRQAEWKNQGWAGYGADGQAGAFGKLSNDDAYASGRDSDEERIPVAEEQLRVGKREVERGGARVRSYVREVPVHEQVQLREEHVEVERRPVDQRMDAGDMRDGEVFRDREIEMTERSEEAVVAKEARVTEEVVVRKTSEERTENIDDTVRKTEVNIDDLGEKQRSAFSGLDRDKHDSERTGSDYERSGTDRGDRDDTL